MKVFGKPLGDGLILFYQAYGLTFRSALPLPGLLTGETAAQVEVRLGKLPPPPVEPAGGCFFQASPAEAYLYWHDVGAILVRGGREIIVDLGPGAVEQEVHLALLGPVMAILLHQRGLLVLHAGAVAIKGVVVAFLGASGLGKSTLAAACHSRGHSLVTDDLLAVDLPENGAAPLVLPGSPQIRLSPEATFLLNQTPEALPPGHPQKNKVLCRAGHGFLNQPLPLRRIYVLTPGRTSEIKPLAPQEALMALVRHTYRISLIHSFKGVANLNDSAKLANRVPIRQLTTARSLARLPELVRLVEKDLAQKCSLLPEAP